MRAHDDHLRSRRVKSSTALPLEETDHPNTSELDSTDFSESNNLAVDPYPIPDKECVTDSTLVQTQQSSMFLLQL